MKSQFVIFLTVLCLAGSIEIGQHIKKKIKSNRLSENAGLQTSSNPTASVYKVYGKCNLNGYWYNQHGSELFINHTDENGEFCGTYRTIVSADNAEPGEKSGKVKGVSTGSLFTFHVFWDKDQASTVWTGQCHKPCNMGFWSSDRFTLHTTWVMNVRVDSCDQQWKASRIGQDVFARDTTLKRVSNLAPDTSEAK